MASIDDLKSKNSYKNGCYKVKTLFTELGFSFKAVRTYYNLLQAKGK